MINVHVPVSGHFTLLVQRKDGKGRIRTVRKHKFDNLITDFGLNSMASLAVAESRRDIIRSVQVGSGSTPPAVSDTSLQAHVATRGVTTETPTRGVVTNQYHWRRWTWQFAQGVAAGNLNEIGVGVNTSAGSLFSRALILDSSGNPVTLTILPTEFLTVVYELRNYPPTGDLVRNVTIDGVARTVTIRPYNKWADTESWQTNMPSVAYYHDLGGAYMGHSVTPSDLTTETATLAGGLSGPSVQSGGLTLGPYVTGSFQLTMTSVFGISLGNVTGGIIKTVVMKSTIGQFQMGIVPGIAKDNTKSFTVSTRISWGRYTP